MMKYELAEKMLENVNGGNYGDRSKDHEAQPMYKIGQTVEVFATPIHHATLTRTITSAEKYRFLLGDGWFWRYNTEDGDGFDADQIERK